MEAFKFQCDSGEMYQIHQQSNGRQPRLNDLQFQNSAAYTSVTSSNALISRRLDTFRIAHTVTNIHLSHVIESPIYTYCL